MCAHKAILLPQTGMSLIVLSPKHTVQGTSGNALRVVLIVTSSAEIVVFLVRKAIFKGNLRPSGIPCVWRIPDIPREILISSLKQSSFGAFYEAVIRGLSHVFVADFATNAHAFKPRALQKIKVEY